jgi:hypothetical protein
MRSRERQRPGPPKLLFSKSLRIAAAPLADWRAGCLTGGRNVTTPLADAPSLAPSAFHPASIIMHLNDEPTTGPEPSGAPPPTSPAKPDDLKPAPLPLTEAAPPRRRSRRRWLYAGGTFFLGILTAEPQASSLAERRGEMVGAGIANLLICLAVAFVFYAVRRSSEPRIARGAFITAVLMFLLDQAGNTRETKEQFAALQRLADSTTGPVEDADAPPRDTNARMLWATRKALEDLLAHRDALARSHGIDLDEAPDGWLSAAYLADARNYPEVRPYLTRYQAYVRDADSTLIPVYTRRMRARLEQSGLAARHIEGVMRGAAKAADRGAARQAFASELELTEQALELDAYLVRVDSRVNLDEQSETAIFDRESERLHVNQLLDRIERLGREVEAHERRVSETMRDLGREFGIESDSAEHEPSIPEPGSPSADVRKT